MRVLLAVTVLLLLACAALLWRVGAPNPPTGPVIAMGLPRTIDPVATSRLDEIRLVGALFEPLARIEPTTLAIRPALATAWTCAADGRTWTFHLRRDACWSDGTPLTAEDMRRGLVRHLAESSPYAALLAALLDGAAVGRGDSVTAITCPDAHTLVLRARHASPEPVAILALPLFAPATPAQMQAGRSGPWADPLHLVGNGPMICVGHQPRHHYDLAPNPRYTGPNRARGPVRVLIVEDAGCAQRLYLDGTVDAILALQSDAVRDCSRARLPGLRRGTSLSTEFLRLRFRPRPNGDEPAVNAALRHPRLRLALARAIDRRVLADEVMEGMGVPATTFTPPSMGDHLPYHPPVGRLGTDLDQARRDLAAAAADLGTIPPLELLVMATPMERLRSAEFVVDSWRRHLGLTVHLAVRPANEVRTLEDAGAFDLGRGSWMGDYLDPTTFLDAWRSDSGINRGRFHDAAYDQLLDRATTATGDERWRLLEEAETRLVDQVPFIPLVHTTCNMLVRPGLTGITPNPLEYVWFDQVGWGTR